MDSAFEQTILSNADKLGVFSAKRKTTRLVDIQKEAPEMSAFDCIQVQNRIVIAEEEWVRRRVVKLAKKYGVRLGAFTFWFNPSISVLGFSVEFLGRVQ